jgi:drug/metabolite transporter (DMT)-like permease
LLVGLERISGISGSLLLNLEGPLTIILGVTLFREHLSRQAAAGAAVIFAGAILLSAQGAGGNADWLGTLLIVAACAAWALDNNLTQSLTLRDPRTLVTIKTGCAGAVNALIAVALGQQVSGLAVLAGALGLGALSYGLSVYWDALALRALGAAREAAIFAIAPFVGALVAPLVLPETFGVQDVAAGVLMAAGVTLLLTERHVHWHRHEPLHHEHAHEHDEHHQHVHDLPVARGARHSHQHVHDELIHSHEHVSDAHHRHAHPSPG